MKEIRQYHLHKDDHFKLHFDINDASPYCKRNERHCFKAHQHSFYQLIWFTKPGKHYVDYELIEHPANALFFLNKKQIHYFDTESLNEGYLFHFDEIFMLNYKAAAENWLRFAIFNELGLPYVVLSQMDAEVFSFFTKLLLSEIKQQSYNYRTQIFHVFQTLLLRIERIKKQQENSMVERRDKNFVLAMEF